MTKSFAISNEMRERVVDKLTQQAVAKHGKRIGAALKKLNEQFWADHMKKVDQLLQVDPKRYPELIAAGVIAATTTESPHVPKAGSPLKFSYSNNSRYPESVRAGEIMKLVLISSEFLQVAAFVKKNDYHNAYELRFSSQTGSVPRLNNMNELDAESKIVKQAKKIHAELSEIFAAADDFHQKAADILASCRTSRQVEDLFPEAAKLLPQPAKKTQALAPVELVDSVRSMLSKGVPDQVGA